MPRIAEVNVSLIGCLTRHRVLSNCCSCSYAETIGHICDAIGNKYNSTHSMITFDKEFMFSTLVHLCIGFKKITENVDEFGPKFRGQWTSLWEVLCACVIS